MIDPELELILSREMLPGEHVVWSGQPDPKRLRKVFAIWTFAIPWTVFALMWEAASLLPWLASSKTPGGIQWSFGIAFPLFGLPFVAIGLGMIAMPFAALRKAKRTVYAMTDRRVLRVTASSKREAESVMLDQMGPIEVRADGDGYGSLRIQIGTRRDSDGDKVIERFEISAVPDVSPLEGLLLERQAAGVRGK